MKFKFSKANLLKKVAVAQEIALTHGDDTQTCIELIVKDGILTIRASNYKLYLETRTIVDSTEDGRAMVPCFRLLSILNNLPLEGNEFSKDEDSNDVLIRATTVRKSYKLVSLSEDREIDIIKDTGFEYFEVPVKTLKSMIGHTAFAVSKDTARYFMSGVLFEKEGKAFNLVGTDGKRLSIDSRELGDTAKDFRSTVHTAMLRIITKYASDEGMIKIARSDKNVFFKFDDYYFACSTIEGNFPNYQRVIPQAYIDSFTVNKRQIIDAIKSTFPMFDKNSGEDHIALTLVNNFIEISSPKSDVGEASIEIDCNHSGDGMSIGFNKTYLLDAVTNVDTDNVVVSFNSPTKAVGIKGENGGYFHIVMPSQG